MATTELMSVATGATNSADFTVVPGTPVTLLLKGTAGVIAPLAALLLTAKTSDGQYIRIRKLSMEHPLVTLTDAGTFRITRLDGTDAVGCDKT